MPHRGPGDAGSPLATLAIVVPAYNEANRLDGSAFAAHLHANPTHRLVFVDDASTDDTRGVVRDLMLDMPERIELVESETNSGKAEAVRTGVQHVLASDDRPTAIAYWDADLAAPLSAATVMARVIAEQPEIDLVLASRVRLLGRDITRRPSRHYIGRVFATGASLALALPVYDTQCGAKLFRTDSLVADAFAEPFRSRWAFDVEMIARYLAALSQAGIHGERRILEYPLVSWADVSGSKVTTGSGMKAFADLFTIGRWLRKHRQPV